MEWSVDQIVKEGPRPLNPNFSINDDLEAFIIPPSKHATLLLKEKNSSNPHLYQSPVPIPYGTMPAFTNNNDYHCTVTYDGNAHVNNREYTYRRQPYPERKYKHRYHKYQDYDSDSSDSNFSCISLPDKKMFENKYRVNNNPYHPVNRPNVSYINRSIYLPTPKIIPTPKTESRTIYLPAAKQATKQKSKSSFVDSIKRNFANNYTDDSSSDNNNNAYDRRSVASSSSEDELNTDMQKTLRDNVEIDWNNNMYEKYDTDDELEFNDRHIIRSYVPYIPEVPHKKEHTDFSTEIKYKKKLINLDDIIKLDLELIAELAKARAASPRRTNNSVNFF